MGLAHARKFDPSKMGTEAASWEVEAIDICEVKLW
jgi:hypothetical protein